MNPGKLVFAQVMEHLPLTTFRRCVERYHGEHKVKTFSCLDQFLCMAFAQLTYRESLRDIEACLRAQHSKLYHPGIRSQIARNTFTTSALLLVGAQIAGAAGRLLWGVWSDRVFAARRKPALVLAGALSALGSVGLGWIPYSTPLWAIWLSVLLYAFSASGWHGSWISLVSEIAGPEKQGRTIGVAMTLMYAGSITLPPLFGLFVDHTDH